MSACIFGVQPESCRMPLPKKEIIYSDWELAKPHLIEKWERIFNYDPRGMYKMMGHLIDPYKRIQQISIHDFFPDIEGECACGCGKEIKKHRRFATEACRGFAWDVRNIICNAHQRPHHYIQKYFGSNCQDCETIWGEQLDHVIGVKHGGGGCWLSNYRYLCHQCHVAKTNKDFGRNGKVSSRKNQTRIEL